jgi:hypothetical protein
MVLNFMWSDGVSEYWSNEKTKKTPDLYFLDQHSTTPILQYSANITTTKLNPWPGPS